MRIYINNRNNLRRGFLKLVNWLRDYAPSHHIIVMDNASTYEPLLQFYADNPELTVYKYSVNRGPYCFWEVYLNVNQDDRFIITDPDMVPTDECPQDLIQHMSDIMDKYGAGKVGPSLRISDIPSHYKHDEQVKSWEAQFWERPTNHGDAYHAGIDTTFAMYEPGSECQPPGSCLRLAPPYTFRHIPWYEDDQPNPERDFYRSHAEQKWIHW